MNICLSFFEKQQFSHFSPACTHTYTDADKKVDISSCTQAETKITFFFFHPPLSTTFLFHQSSVSTISVYFTIKSSCFFFPSASTRRLKWSIKHPGGISVRLGSWATQHTTLPLISYQNEHNLQYTLQDEINYSSQGGRDGIQFMPQIAN